MKNNGGFMGGEILFLLACFCIAIFGVYKYISAETNDYNRVMGLLKAQQGDIKTCMAQLSELERDINERLSGLGHAIATNQRLAVEASQEVDEAQEHMAKLRESQLDLDKRSYPQRIEFNIPKGAIPIEVYTPTRKATKKKVLKKKVIKKKPVRKKAVKKKVTKKKAVRKKSMPGLKSSKRALKKFEEARP